MPSPIQKRDETDSEDDEDYVPPAGEDDSGSEESDADAQTNEPASTTNEPLDEVARKNAREALWASFQESVNKAVEPTTKNQPPKLVKIERRRLFAGKEVLEVVEVPEGSPEANKWPLWIDPQQASIPAIESSSSTASAVKEENTPPTEPVPDIPHADSDTHLSPGPKPLAKRPAPRKNKIMLAPLPGSSKPKKMTTLDKSAMDWKAHLHEESTAGSSVTDELAANRKGGGYLEKVEFLKRVEERKEETLESLKASKRRRL